jgi:molybdopterin converting factor small subunit
MISFESVYWGMVAEVADCRHETWELNSSETVLTFKSRLLEKYPQLKDMASVKFAVNDEYCSDSQSINENAEVNVIPPVSGG